MVRKEKKTDLMCDDLTNAILTNPDLLARAQGKEMRLKCVWQKWDGTDMIDIECGNDTWVIAKHLIMPDDSQRR